MRCCRVWSEAPLRWGVIPMGTANALAADLGLPAIPGQGGEDAAGRDPDPGFRWAGSSIVITGERRARATSSSPLESARTLFLISRLDSRLKQRFGYALYIRRGFSRLGHALVPHVCGILCREWIATLPGWKRSLNFWRFASATLADCCTISSPAPRWATTNCA